MTCPPRSWLAALLVMACQSALALTPPPQMLETGFATVGAAQGVHLPANAKGVLFRAELPPEARVIEFRPGVGTILAKAPLPLLPVQFVITSADGKRIKAQVQTLDYPAPRPGHILPYLALSERAPCTSFSAPKCALPNDAAERTQVLQGMVSKGWLSDISVQVRQADGLFRIAPTSGFKAGMRYSFRYQHRGDELMGRSLPGTAEIEVDRTAIAPDNAVFRLAPVGAAKPMVVAGGWTQVTKLVQTVRLEAPARYGEYAALLSYSVRATPAPGCLPYCQDFLERTPGGKTGETNFSVACSASPSPRRQYAAVGSAGLLEMEDVVHLTAPLSFRLGDRGERCEGTLLLRQAAGINDLPGKREAICNVMAVPREQVLDGTAYMQLLTALASNPDAAIRRCALRGIAHYDTNIRTTSDVAFVQPPQVMHAVHMLALGMRDRDATVREAAIYQLHGIQSALRLRGGDLRAYWRAFQPAMPALIALIGDPAQPQLERRLAIELIGHLGSSDAVAIAVLGRVLKQDDVLLSNSARHALTQLQARSL